MHHDLQPLLESDGWKELRYSSLMTDFMTSGNDEQRCRLARPPRVRQDAAERELDTSGAGVKLYDADQNSMAKLAGVSSTRKEMLIEAHSAEGSRAWSPLPRASSFEAFTTPLAPII